MAHSPEEEPLCDLYTVPISSGWFRWDEIHETERRSLPEFFEGGSLSRNPRVYKEYRDFIISKYREDPSRRLRFMEIRKSLIGDVGALYRVFRFLDQWGLINFGAGQLPQGGGVGGGDGGLMVVVEEGPPSGVQVVPTVPALGSVAAGSLVCENGFRMPSLTSYSDVFGDWVPEKGPLCGLCGENCEAGGYGSIKDGIIKCAKCLEDKDGKNGNSAEDSKSNDLANGSSEHTTSTWTDAETLLLLEAVLKHGDDWDLIAQHVRTKSKLDCIARLIQLPLGEHVLGTFANRLDNKSSSSQATVVEDSRGNLSEHLQDPLIMERQHDIHGDETTMFVEEDKLIQSSKRRCLPSLLEATDSMMKQVALLSTVAGPHVAAAAAEAAVTALSNDKPSARKVFEGDQGTDNFGPCEANDELLSDVVEDQETERHILKGRLESGSGKSFATTAFQMRGAIATALGAAAARAKLQADHEEKEIEQQMASIIDMQLRKIQHKVKHLEELEFIMDKECFHIQQLKISVIDDWLGVLHEAFQAGIPRWRDHGIPWSLLNSIL